MKLFINVLALLSIFSMAFYAITGVALWSPIVPTEDGGMRFLLLCVLHMAPVIYVVYTNA